MTNAEARFIKSLRPRKPEGSLGRTAQDVHLDSHTAPELCFPEQRTNGYMWYLCRGFGSPRLWQSPGEIRRGRWGWALIFGRIVLLLSFPQRLLFGHCLCDFASHSCWTAVPNGYRRLDSGSRGSAYALCVVRVVIFSLTPPSLPIGPPPSFFVSSLTAVDSCV